MATAKSFEEFVIRVLKGTEHRFTDEMSVDDKSISDLIKASYVHALRQYAIAEKWHHNLIQQLIVAGSKPGIEPILITECASTIDALKGRDFIKRAYMAAETAIEADRYATLWGCLKGGAKGGRVTLPDRKLNYVLPGKKRK